MLVVNEYHRRKGMNPSELSLGKAEAFLSQQSPIVKHGILYWSDSEFAQSKLARNSGTIDAEQMKVFCYTHSGIWTELNEIISLGSTIGNNHNIIVVPRLDGMMMVVNWEIAKLNKQCRRTARLFINLDD